MAFGWLSVKRTVRASSFLMLPGLRSLSRSAPAAPVFGFRIRLKLKTTSSAVTVLPLLNSRPGFRRTVNSVAAAFAFIGLGQQVDQLVIWVEAQQRVIELPLHGDLRLVEVGGLPVQAVLGASAGDARADVAALLRRRRGRRARRATERSQQGTTEGRGGGESGAPLEDFPSGQRPVAKAAASVFVMRIHANPLHPVRRAVTISGFAAHLRPRAAAPQRVTRRIPGAAPSPARPAASRQPVDLCIGMQSGNSAAGA